MIAIIVDRVTTDRFRQSADRNPAIDFTDRRDNLAAA
jgi:hypothetical protein